MGSKVPEFLLVAFDLLQVHWAEFFLFLFYSRVFFFLPKKILVILNISIMIIYFLLELRYLLALLSGRVTNEEEAKPLNLLFANKLGTK